MTAPDQRLANADALLKKGQKLAKGGFFSKKNPDEAEKAFDEARKLLRPIRPVTEDVLLILLPVLEGLANARYEMNLFYGAAEILEEAARTVSGVKGENCQESVGYLREAATYWRMNKQYEKASKTLQLAAIAEGTRNIDEGLNIFDQCLEIMEVENRFKTCHEFFDAAVKFAVENKRYQNAIKFLERQIKQFDYDITQFIKRIHRNICSIMIIHFHLKNVKEAQRVFDETSGKYAVHGKTPEWTLASNLLIVFEKADVQGLETIKKSGDLGLYLINAVSRVATSLNMTDIHPSKEQAKIEKEEIKEEAKEAVTEDVLKSEAEHFQVDETGLPDMNQDFMFETHDAPNTSKNDPQNEQKTAES